MSIVKAFIDQVSPLVLNGAISDAAVKILDDLLTKIEHDPQKVTIWVNDAISKLRPLPRAEHIINKLQDFHPVVTKLRTPTPHIPSTHRPVYDGMPVGPHNKPKEGHPLPLVPHIPPAELPKGIYDGDVVGPAEYGNWDRAKDWGPWVGGLAALGILLYATGGLSAGLSYLAPAIQASGQVAARAPSYLKLDFPDELAPSGEQLANAVQATKDAFANAKVPQFILDTVNPQTYLEAAKTVTEPLRDVASLAPEQGYTQYLIDIAKSAYPTIQNWAFDQAITPTLPEGAGRKKGGRVKRTKAGPLDLFLGEVLANAPTQLPTPKEAARESLNAFKNHIEEVLRNKAWTRQNVSEAVRISTHASGIDFPKEKLDKIVDYVIRPIAKNETKAINALKNLHTSAPPPKIQPDQLPADAEPKIPGDEAGLSNETGIHIPPLNAFDIGESGAVENEIGPEQQRWIDDFLKPRTPEENQAWLANRALEYQNEQAKAELLDNIARMDSIVFRDTLGAPKGYAPSLMDYVTPQPTMGDVHTPSIDNQSELIRGIHRTR